MPNCAPIDSSAYAAFTDQIIQALRSVTSQEDLSTLMESIVRQMGFRYFALIHHDDLDRPRPDRVDIKHYPPAITERLFAQRRYRRDPVIRGCFFADSAFLWSQLERIIFLDQKDRDAFAIGAREGLNEGITVPYFRVGECMGSTTFAGVKDPRNATRYLGMAQMIGIFAFQAARGLVVPSIQPLPSCPVLHPRPRDCVILAGRGCSNKQIARKLGITPRTVDCYLTEARQLFDVHDRTELVISAILAGQIGLHELRPLQPE